MRNRMEGAGVAGHGLEWDDLRTFLMIARHHTLSGAARALGVQQPTMGRRLEALEQRAGAKLLLKTPGGYVLTEAGEAVLGNVERIEAETLAVERAVAGRDAKLDGIVRLTTVETVASEVLPPILNDLRRSHPGIAVEIVAGTCQLSLTRREADLALRLGGFAQAELVARKVADVGYGLYAAPAYVERHGAPDFAAGAPGHRVILSEPDLQTLPEMAWLRGMTGRATVAVTVNSRIAQREMAAAGLGLTALARYLGDACSGLVRLDVAGTPERELWMGVHADIRHTPRIRAVTEALAVGLRRLQHRLRPAPDAAADVRDAAGLRIAA